MSADVALSTSWCRCIVLEDLETAQVPLDARALGCCRREAIEARLQALDRVCDLRGGETLPEADVAPRDRVRHPDRLLGVRAGGGERDQVVVRVGRDADRGLQLAGGAMLLVVPRCRDPVDLARLGDADRRLLDPLRVDEAGLGPGDDARERGARDEDLGGRLVLAPGACWKTLTATIPSTIRPMSNGSDRRIAALRASTPPEVIGSGPSKHDLRGAGGSRKLESGADLAPPAKVVLSDLGGESLLSESRALTDSVGGEGAIAGQHSYGCPSGVPDGHRPRGRCRYAVEAIPRPNAHQSPLSGSRAAGRRRGRQMLPAAQPTRPRRRLLVGGAARRGGAMSRCSP